MRFFFLLSCFFLLLSCGDGTKVGSSNPVVAVDSLLHQAACLQDRVQLKQAAQVYQKAICQAEQESDSNALLTAFHRLGIVYRLQSLKDSALVMQEKAWEWRNLIVEDSLKADILQEKARLFALQSRDDSASNYFRLALDLENRVELWQEWSAMYEIRKENKQAINLLLLGLSHSDVQIPGEVWLSLCRLYLKRNMPDSAAVYLSHVQSLHPKISFYQSEIAYQRGDTVLAAFHRSRYEREQYALSRQDNTEMLSRHLYAVQSKELAEAKKEVKFPIAWLLLLLPLLGIPAYLFTRRKEIVPVVQDQQFRSSEIFFRFHRKEEWHPKPQDWETLFVAFNEAYPGFTDRLKKCMPAVSQVDLQMCCLIRMDVAPSIIAQLLCCTNAAVSMKRGRLYQKITGEKGTPEQCDRFIREI